MSPSGTTRRGPWYRCADRAPDRGHRCRSLRRRASEAPRRSARTAMPRSRRRSARPPTPHRRTCGCDRPMRRCAGAPPPRIADPVLDQLLDFRPAYDVVHDRRVRVLEPLARTLIGRAEPASANRRHTIHSTRCIGDVAIFFVRRSLGAGLRSDWRRVPSPYVKATAYRTGHFFSLRIRSLQTTRPLIQSPT
jgi:hypothetical protein